MKIYLTKFFALKSGFTTETKLKNHLKSVFKTEHCFGYAKVILVLGVKCNFTVLAGIFSFG